jgi:hypothetical protein
VSHQVTSPLNMDFIFPWHPVRVAILIRPRRIY